MTGNTLEVLLSGGVTSLFILPYYSLVDDFLICREEYVWYFCFNSDTSSVGCLPVYVISFLCWILEAICSWYKTTPEICLTLRLQWLLTAFLTSTFSPRSHYLPFRAEIFCSGSRLCLLYMLGFRPPESAVSRQW